MVYINFLPKHRRCPGIWQKELLWALSGAFFALTICASFFYFLLLQQQEAKWQQAWNQYQLLLPAEAARCEEARLQEQIESKEGLVKQVQPKRSSLEMALRNIRQALPPQVWLQEISAEAGGQLHLKGMALTQQDLVGFMKNLEVQPSFGTLHLELLEKDEQRLTHFDLSLCLKGR